MSNSDRSPGKARPLGPGASADADSGSDYDRALVRLGLGVPAAVRLRGGVG